MKKLTYLLIAIVVLLILYSIVLSRKYNKLEDSYITAIENNKAYDAELSVLENNNRVYKFTVDQLNYLNDSIIRKMDDLRKEIGIKDSKIEQMQYRLSHISKVDTLILKDTIFRDHVSIDTLIGDKWYKTRVELSYPSTIKLSPQVKLESFVYVSQKRETVKPPKKFFLFRWFQKKMTVLNITLIENNPYVTNDKQKFVEILK